MTYLEREEFVPLTISRRDYILKMLARPRPESWIRISLQEFSDFGGTAFFEGCTVQRMRDDNWFSTASNRGWVGQAVRVQLDVRITVLGGQGWTPEKTYYDKYCVSATTTNEGKPEMQEHHIARSKLIEVVTENKQKYAEKFGRLKALYTDEIEAATQRHLDRQIPLNQIMVKDKDGNRIDLPIDMSDSFDQHLRALDLDARDVIILNQEEYYQMVTATSSNLLQVEGLIKKLDELP